MQIMANNHKCARKIGAKFVQTSHKIDEQNHPSFFGHQVRQSSVVILLCHLQKWKFCCWHSWEWKFSRRKSTSQTEHKINGNNMIS